MSTYHMGSDSPKFPPSPYRPIVNGLITIAIIEALVIALLAILLIIQGTHI